MTNNQFRFRPNALVLATVLGLTASVLAGDQKDQEKMPSAAAVMKKFVDVTGGAAKYQDIKSVKMKGKMSAPEQGINGTVGIQMIVPDKLLVEIVVPDTFTETKGSNGEVVWSSNTMMGPRILEGKERESTLAEANFQKVYDPEKFYKELEVVGVKEVDGEKCYEVKLTKKDGLVETQLYSIESGLHVGSESVVATQMGDMNVVVSLGDYKESGGVKFPHKIEQKISGTNVGIEFDSIEVNPKLAASMFELPEEVKALIVDGDVDEGDSSGGR